MFVTRYLNIASVKVDLAALLFSGFDQSKNSIFGSRRNNWSTKWREKGYVDMGLRSSQVDVLLKTAAHLQVFGEVNEVC